MVETTEIPEEEMVLPEPGHGDGVVHAHPGSGQYIKIALILGAITLVEVLIYYFDLDHRTLVGSLIVLSAAKFALVAGYFMHLKFDSKIFTTFFAGALAMAIAAFVAVLFMFHAI